MSNTKIIRSTFFLTIATFLTSCATPYYGYSENDWNKLSDDERKTTRSEYKDIVDAKNDQRHRDKINSMKDKIIDRGVNPH